MTEPSRPPVPATEVPGDGRAQARPSPGGPGARRPLPKRPGFLPTILASVATFLVLFEFLAFQLSSGNDPALGAPTQVAAVQKPRPIVNRRIIKTRVVKDPPRVTEVASSSGSLAVPAPSSTGSAPAAAPAPSPAAAPAPAPAAAPVTSTS